MHRYGMNILQRQPSDYILNIPGAPFMAPANPQGPMYNTQNWVR